MGCKKERDEYNKFKIALGGVQLASIDPTSHVLVIPIAINVCETLIYHNKNNEISPRLASPRSLSRLTSEDDFNKIGEKEFAQHPIGEAV